MAGMIFLSDAAKAAKRAASSLNRDATTLRNRPVDIGTDNLLDFMNRMRETYASGVEPLRLAGIPDDPAKTAAEMLAIREAKVNGLVDAMTLHGPTDTYARILRMQAGLNDLYAAYLAHCHTSTDFAKFTVEGGGVYSRVSDLSPLYPALDQIIDATAPFAD